MIPESERGWAQLVRQEARGRMRYLLPAGPLPCLPTTPFPTPKRGEPLSMAGRSATAFSGFVVTAA
jgi:amidase